jgi:hypothetical protein
MNNTVLGSQTVVKPTVLILTVDGITFTATVIGLDVAIQPPAVVTSTVKVPAVAAVTVID